MSIVYCHGCDLTVDTDYHEDCPRCECPPIDMKIITHHVCPPIPDRSCDWSAIDDHTYDPVEDGGALGKMSGWGPTPEAAIADLKEQRAEYERCLMVQA